MPLYEYEVHAPADITSRSFASSRIHQQEKCPKCGGVRETAVRAGVSVQGHGLGTSPDYAKSGQSEARKARHRHSKGRSVEPDKKDRRKQRRRQVGPFNQRKLDDVDSSSSTPAAPEPRRRAAEDWECA